MRTSALLLAALVAVTLTGCQPDHPPVVPQPEPSATPLFASEEEALAAAEEAFAAYLAVSDQIFADGGKDPERLLEVATPTHLESELPGYENYVEQGKRSEGSTTFDTAHLQSVDLSGYARSDVVVVYACEDFSQLSFFDSSGSSITNPDRRTRWPVSVTFDANENLELRVAGVDEWTGQDFCEPEA